MPRLPDFPFFGEYYSWLVGNKGRTSPHFPAAATAAAGLCWHVGEGWVGLLLYRRRILLLLPFGILNITGGKRRRAGIELRLMCAPFLARAFFLYVCLGFVVYRLLSSSYVAQWSLKRSFLTLEYIPVWKPSHFWAALRRERHERSVGVIFFLSYSECFWPPI